MNISDDRYLAALKRIRASIESGIPCEPDNSDVIGNKHNHCNWGLCSGRKEDWPNPEDHVWPDQFIKDGRVAPLQRQNHQVCPMDTRMQEIQGDPDINWGNGCFWACRIFKRRKRETFPTRDEAIALYDQAIERIKREEP